jgi:hypothetical protein
MFHTYVKSLLTLLWSGNKCRIVARIPKSMKITFFKFLQIGASLHTFCCYQIRSVSFAFSFPCYHLTSSVRSSRLLFCAHISEDIGSQLVVIEQMLKIHRPVNH